MKQSKPYLTKPNTLYNELKTSFLFIVQNELSFLFLLLLPLFLLFVLLFVSDYNQYLQKEIAQKNLFTTNSSRVAFTPLPRFIDVKGPPDISANAALVMDSDSKVVLFAKNENLRFSMASTTKIMTALAALDYFGLDNILTVKTDFVTPSVAGFQKGEQLTFENLLYAMFLPSANDAAVAIAQNYPGGEKNFVEKMNEKAQKWYLYNTHFGDPAGLLDDENYTTARDLARLASFAIQSKTLSKIFSTRQYTITDVLKKNSYNLKNINILLGFDGVNGIKTGYTHEAGGVLVTSKAQGDHTFVLIVIGSEDRFLDTQKLLEMISNKIEYVRY